MKILADLEAQEFLEILEISDHNIFYRFTHPFMRETIYQRMTYTQRRGIHRSVAEVNNNHEYRPFKQCLMDSNKKRVEREKD